MLASEPGGLGESRLEELVTTIMENMEIPDRTKGISRDFMFAIDHCF